MSHDAVQPFDPSVSVPSDAPLTKKSTLATPMSSVAVAATGTTPETVEVSVGFVMWTTGRRSPGVPPSTAWSALTSGSAIPSGSLPHWPFPTQSPLPSSSAKAPLGHSPVDFRSSSTSAGLNVGWAARISAATPVTCGAAMLVPISDAYPPPVQSE